jgi:trans-2-enoyl-CoA reductase
MEYSDKLQEIDNKVSELSTLFGNSKWFDAYIEAGNLWEKIKELSSSEMQSMKQTTLRIYIEARLRMDKMELADDIDIMVWMKALYATGGRNFENVWLELLIDANNKIIPQNILIKEVYGYLLENFSTCDGEKMEQLDRMNEVRKIL